ncbi:MAG TPA: NINE protein [Dehalococcoidia bacterium]|jgi:TM2 domain-containing membrane protein YozV|nr:NINE protein [Dehalococcoidia bacterium]
MPLINCPDCGKEVSTEALACPGCGRPVKSAQASWSGPSGTAQSPTHYQPTPVVVQAVKSRGLFIILGLLLGCLGIHNFYAGYYGRGAIQLIITSVLGWVIVGFVITAVWALIEVITVKVDAQGNPMS